MQGFWLRLVYLGGIIAGAYEAMPSVVRILTVIMVADIMTGLLRAGVTHTIDPHLAFVGITKKVAVLILVGVSFYIQYETQTPIGTGVAGFYAASEGISMIDNAIGLGLPVPDFLKQLFQQWSEHGNNPQPATTPQIGGNQ